MKAFYLTICLFTVMILAICVNYYYIESFAGEAIAACTQLIPFAPSPNAHTQIAQIHEKWERNKKFIQITVNHTEIELIDNALDELLVYAEGGSAEDFEKARLLAINALEELRLSERLTFTNIL